MGLLWSIFNGFMAVLFGLKEILWWGYLRWWRGHPTSYSTVSEIWLERTFREVIYYGVGQVLFVSWPLLLYHLQHLLIPAGSADWIGKDTVRLLVCGSALAFGLFTLITLVIPIGARSRDFFLPPRTSRTGYERLFLGQMEPYLLLSAKGDGAKACLREALIYVLLIAGIAGTVQYSIWIDDPKSMSLSCAKTEAGTCREGRTALYDWFDFMYWSAITMSTTGYGDIYPVDWKCKIVAMSEVLIGWMYLAGLLPTLINLAVSAPGQKSSRTAPSDGIKAAVLTRTVEWFRQAQQPWGGWKGHLTPDLAATACGYLALRRVGSVRSKSKCLIEGLQRYLETELIRTSRTADPVGCALGRIALGGAISEEEFKEAVTLAQKVHRPSENAPMLLGLVTGIMKLVPFGTAQQTFPPDLDEWKVRYGSHWGCYALLARLLECWSKLDQSGASEFARRLLAERSSGGSWHGDVMLTSLVLLSFQQMEIFETKRADGRAWLLDLAREYPAGLPVIRSLELWDTGLVLSALAPWESARNIVEPGVEWLAQRSKRATDDFRAWSWSEEARMICCDTSSLACTVLASMRIENCEVESTIRSCVSLLAKHTSQSHRCPTFIDGDLPIDECPIISGRCVALLSTAGFGRRIAASQIMHDVASQGWQSPWFADVAITQGLVLYYLAPFCDEDLEAVRELISSLSRVHAAKDAANEAVASALLGLSHAGRYIDIGDGGRAASLQLSKLLLEREVSGEWSPSRVGVFGFGRKYADPVFSTTMAFKALFEQVS